MPKCIYTTRGTRKVIARTYVDCLKSAPPGVVRDAQMNDDSNKYKIGGG